MVLCPARAMDPRCLWLWALLTGAALGCEQHPSPWSMHIAPEITGLRGDSIVLPCNFSYPGPNYTGEIWVIWKLERSPPLPDPPPFFQCQVKNDSARDSFNNCMARPDPSRRYSLAGDPRRHDLSLRIAGLSFQDGGNYVCRVVFTEQPGCAWEKTPGTQLTVEATPTILNLSLLSGPLPGRVACTVEGKPRPNIMWRGPWESRGIMEPERPPGPEFQVTEVVTANWTGTYTCWAENVHGRAERSLVLGTKEKPLSPLLIPLLSAALILLLILLLLVLGWRWRGHCPVPRRAPAAPVGLHHDAPSTGGKKSMGNTQAGDVETCPPCQPATHTHVLSPPPAENPDGCTYADLAFPGAGVGASRSGHQPEAQSPPAPEQEVTYSELMLSKGPK